MKYSIIVPLTISLSLGACASPNMLSETLTSGNPQTETSSIPVPTPSVLPSPESSSVVRSIPEQSANPITNSAQNTNADASKVASIVFAPGTNRFLNKEGEERQFNIVLLDAAGNVLPTDSIQLKWLSSRPRDISVDNTGKVKANAGLGFSRLSVSVVGTNIEKKLLLDVTDPSFFSSFKLPSASQASITRPKPVIENLSITNGVPGQTLIITGLNFSNTLSENTVRFGNVTAQIVSSTSTRITIKIPETSVGNKDITVEVNNQSSLDKTFVIDPLVNFKINGENAGDNSSIRVSSAGDINGDGKEDIIIGAPFSDINGADSGSSYVIYGGSVTTAVYELSSISTP